MVKSSGDEALDAPMQGIPDGLALESSAQHWDFIARQMTQPCAESESRGRRRLTHAEVKHAWVQDLVCGKEVEVMRNELANPAMWEPTT